MVSVYWISDDTCSDILHSGYVGVSNDAVKRFKHHIRNNRVPLDSKLTVIFEGTREECFNKEFELRPAPFIGWNNVVGGSHGWRSGFKHSDETRTKLKEAWNDNRRKQASIQAIELNKTLIGRKRPKQSLALSGNKNPMYGKTHTVEAKAKISAAHKDKIPHNKSDTICSICGKSASPFILIKYHGDGRKRCNGA